jgi:maltooligosyltrehalose trehalohydrolase
VDGYYEDFGETSHLAKALNDSYVYTGQYSIHRKKLFGKEPVDSTYDQFVVFAQNHDQIGNRMLGDRLTTQLSPEGLKLAAASYLLAPQVPMLFMGEEYGEKNPFQYFISHTDKELVDLVRKGRKEEFSYFQWKGEVPDPFSEKTFRQCMLSWAVETAPDAQTLFSFYQHLIEFRKTRPAMNGRTRDSLNVLTSEDKVICFERKYKEDHLLFILNFNKHKTSFISPATKTFKNIFDSSTVKWGGTGPARIIEIQPHQRVDLNPESVLIFE